MNASVLVLSNLFVALTLFGSAGAAPLAGPPLPLDPVLSAIAPQECLWYMSSAGTTTADPSSSNHAEQLLAEVEVIEFSRMLEQQILQAIRRTSKSEPSQVLASELPLLAKIFLTHPMAAYVEEVQVKGLAAVEVSSGFVLNARDEKKAIEATLVKLMELKGKNGPPISEETINGEVWHVLQTPPMAPSIRWGWHNNYFIVAVGDGTAERIVERMDGSAPAWLEEVRRKSPVEREISLGYVNVAGILDRVKPFVEGQEGWDVAEKLGLTSIQSLYGVAGFDAEGCTSFVHLVTEGQRRGLLALVPYRPLSKRDLQTIPKDALLAVAKRIDFGEVWDAGVELIREFEPAGRERDIVKQFLEEVENELGLNIKEDLIDLLDDVVVAHVPGGDLFTSWLGSVAAIRVKDADRLKKVFDKLVAIRLKQPPRDHPNAANEFGFHVERRIDVTIRKTEFKGHTIYFTNVVGEPFPLAPAWCLTDEWLICGVMPQAVRTALQRKADDSLASVPAVREMLAAENGASVILYQDTPRLVRSLYPLLQMFAQVACTQLQKEGIDVDISLLPSTETLVKHLRPGVSTLSHSSDGFCWRSRHSLPGSGGVIGAVPVAVPTILPAIQAARRAAQLNSELNNMRNIALAFHRYADVRKEELPTNIYSKDKKTLLSWRVAILPYLGGEEERVLYAKFHLDEPWDSEHNLRLVSQMPQAYRSSIDAIAVKAGKTRYVGLVCEESIFRTPVFLPNRRVRGTIFSSIRDGMSNTFMFVRSAPSYNVIWTKPDDIAFDKEKPFAHLKSPEGFFLAAFCDCSCRRIHLDVDEKTIRSLVTRAGHEVIGELLE